MADSNSGARQAPASQPEKGGSSGAPRNQKEGQHLKQHFNSIINEVSGNAFISKSKHLEIDLHVS